MKTCSFPGCERRLRAKGLCTGHYRQSQLGKPLAALGVGGSVLRGRKNPLASTRRPEFLVWSAMKRRCLNKACDKYHRYGGRGITVCIRWRGENGFVNFLSDMGPRPTLKHRIERRNNDGNYEPGNCRWATQKEQMRNTSANRVLVIGGISKPMVVWAEEYGIPYKLVHDRITKKGWDPERALTTPPRYREHCGGHQCRALDCP